MQRLIFILATLGVVAPAAAATRSYIVTDFNALRVEAPIEVVVESGRGVSAKGEGDADMLARLDFAVSAQTLTVRLVRSPYESRRERPDGPVRLHLTVPSLRRAQLSGSGNLKVSGLDRLRAELGSAGSGNLSVTGIQSDNLAITQAGSGTVTVAGRTNKLTVQTVGSGQLDGKALAAIDVGLAVEGSGSVDLAASRSAKVIATGSGTVTVTGKAACTVSHAGSGSVSCGGKSY